MAFCKRIEGDKYRFGLQPTCRRCRYHKTGEVFPAEDMAPRGLCLEAFHAAFPLAFAMFSAPRKKVPDGLRVVCPAGQIVLCVFRKPLISWRLSPEQILRRVASLVFTCEVLRWRVFFRIETAGRCPYNYHEGETFEINIGDLEALCPAAFNAFFPFFIPWLYGDGQSPPLLACPDHKTNVMAGGNDFFPITGLNPDRRICTDIHDTTIEVLKATDNPRVRLKVGTRFQIGELLGRVGIPCLSYLNTVAPYVYVARKGGRLGFYTNTYKAAIVQCPSPHEKTVTEIRQHQDGSSTFTVKSSRRDCPLGMMLNKTYYSAGSEEVFYWFMALACLSPYLLNRKFSKDQTIAFSLPENVFEPSIFRIV